MAEYKLPYEANSSDLNPLLEMPNQGVIPIDTISRGDEQDISRRGFLRALAGLGGVVVVSKFAVDHMHANDNKSVAEAHVSVLNSLPEIDSSQEIPESSRRQFEAHYPAIDHMRPVYGEIEEETGVPWQFMAAIHYREGGNSPISSMYAGEKLGTTNPDFGDVKGSDIFANGVLAANHFKDMAKRAYGVEVRNDMPDEELAYAFLAYNRGSMYRNAKQYIGREMTPHESPYVMNGIDDAHLNMAWPNAGHYGAGIDWGEPQSVQGRHNTPLGALTIVRCMRERMRGGEQINQRRIVIIGDSLSIGDDKFGKIQEVDRSIQKQIIHYDALGGRPFYGENDGVSAIDAAMPFIARADSLVIALGTNMPESEATYRDKLNAVIAKVQRAKPSIKIIVPEIIGYNESSTMKRRRDERNATIQDLAKQGLLTYLPLDMPLSEFQPDGVHLTAEGYKQRTAKILQAA